LIGQKNTDRSVSKELAEVKAENEALNEKLDKLKSEMKKLEDDKEKNRVKLEELTEKSKIKIEPLSELDSESEIATDVPPSKSETDERHKAIDFMDFRDLPRLGMASSLEELKDECIARNVHSKFMNFKHNSVCIFLNLI